MSLKKYVFLFFLYGTIGTSLAQISPEKKSISIDFSKLKKKNPDNEKQPSSPDFNTGIGFKNTAPNLSNKVKGGFIINSIIDTENFGKPKKDLGFGKPPEAHKYITSQQPRFLKNIKDEGPILFRDQSLGDITTKSDYVILRFRDYGNVDGDAIKIVVNDKVLIDKVLLPGHYTYYKIKLIEGFNRIDFKALNNGLYAPNTAQLIVNDDDGNSISNNKWNLTTGFKATLIIIKN